MDIVFPPNASDGQIFEAAPGVVYKYLAISNSWTRIVRPTIPLATGSTPGLMSSADYEKLTGIILPPPQCTIRSADCAQDVACQSRFSDRVSSGFISFEGDGVIKFDVSPDNIHENTGLINITLDVDALVKKLKDAGQFKMTAPSGDPGEQGDPGDPGLDALPVGPYGDDGEPGTPAEWPGSLIEEGLVVKDDNRAVVDVRTEEVSPNENYIVVTRANIGNPSACPDSIKPKDVQSPWLLAFTTTPSITVKRSTYNNKLVCSRSCDSDIYYLNIENIVRNVRAQYIRHLEYNKREKEQYVTELLGEMVTSFDEQKAALGCALEACRSKYRNADARRYIETQKIAAAAARRNLRISSLSTAGYRPSFFRRCDYTVVRLDDIEVPIVDPNELEEGEITSTDDA